MAVAWQHFRSRHKRDNVTYRNNKLHYSSLQNRTRHYTKRSRKCLFNKPIRACKITDSSLVQSECLNAQVIKGKESYRHQHIISAQCGQLLKQYHPCDIKKNTIVLTKKKEKENTEHNKMVWKKKGRIGEMKWI